jgi:glutamate 5-kinase
MKKSLGGKGRLGRGGIRSKVKAAEIATTCGIPVLIANSRRENVIADILAGKPVGTYFKAQPRMPAVKRWIAYGASVKGQIHINDGAKEAIFKGSSLLPVGVTKVVGQFKASDVVSIVGEDGIEFAKGNPNYSSDELNLIKGLRVTQIKKALGNLKPQEVVEHKNIHLEGNAEK